MRPDIEAAIARALALRARLRGLPNGDVSPQEIEDTLCEGYAEALAGDAWLMRTERRRHELIDDPSCSPRGRDLRALTSEHGRFQRDLVALRRELAELRREHDRLRAESRAGAS